MKNSLLWLGLLAAMTAPSTDAANREIRALFQPDPAQPNKNVFVNKTPASGYCTLDPAQCADNNMFSIQLPVRFNSSRSINVGEGVSLKVPADWRRLTVTHAQTQKTETVEVRIIGVGSNYVLSQSAASLVGVTDPLEGHQKLWTSNSWVYAPAPCQYSGVGWYSPNSYRFFWKAPLPAPCMKTAAYKIPSMSFDTVDFAYELRTPNPLGMASGLYEGSLSYSLGPGGDFDFGYLMHADDPNLTLDFVLDVQHTLKVDIPPGGDKVTLEPEGGWQQWIDGGRKPARIYRDQPFYISASTPFKMKMNCDRVDFFRCYLRSASGQRTELMVSVTMPAGITNPVIAPSIRLRSDAWTPFTPTQYVDRKPGTLVFEMGKDSIDRLLVPGFSDHFTGDITIVWDSEV